MSKLLPIVEKIVDEFRQEVKERPHTPMNDSLIPFILLTADKWPSNEYECISFQPASSEPEPGSLPQHNLVEAINARFDKGDVVIETFVLRQYLPPTMFGLQTDTHIRRWNRTTTHLSYYSHSPHADSPLAAIIHLEDIRAKNARFEWKIPATREGEKFLRGLHTLFVFEDYT